MKFQIIALLAIASFSTFASDSLISKKLAGKYELVKASKKGAAYYCGKELQIEVNEDAVYVDSGNGHSNFRGDDKCSTSAGDIGPLNVNCTSFSVNKASSSRTSPVTIVGFIRETESVKLSRDGQKLVYKKDSTLVPAGILRLWEDDKYTCEYKRIN